MAYWKYDPIIFADFKANTIGNKLVETVITKFSLNDANTKFALTGCAARHFQNPATFDNVRGIQFITSSMGIYEYFAANIASIVNTTSAIAYIDRIRVITSEGFYLEIWYTSASLNIVDYSGVKLQNDSQIPSSFASCPVSGGTLVDYAPLILSPGQSFNPGSNQLYNQPWEFSPVKISQDWIIGNPVPSDITIFTRIRNYATDKDFVTFSEINVELYVNRGESPGLIADFFTALIDGGPDYDLAGSALVVNTVISFVNFSLMEAGDYASTLDFIVTGLDSRTAKRGIMERIKYPVGLKVISNGKAYTEPTKLDYVHTIGEALPPPQNLYINIEGEYTLTFAKIFSITGASMTDESNKNFYVKRTTGKRTFAVYLNNTVEYAGEGFFNHAITIGYSGGSIVVPVSISQAPTNEIRVMPPYFEFEAVIGVLEAEPKALEVVSPLSYTYDIPSWISVSGTLGTSFKGWVIPAASSNFSPGLYEDNIVFTSSAGSVSIPIKYRVKANSFTELLPNKINFTKDQLYVNLATKIVGVYLKVTMDIKVYDFLGAETVLQYPLHVPIFNGKASFHPGTTVDSLMAHLKNISQFVPADLESRIEKPFHYYRPAVLNLTMEQTAYSNDVLVKKDELNNILFAKGTRPINFDDDCGLMFAQYPIRVTRNSYSIFNFVKRTGVHAIEIEVNGKTEKTIRHDTVADSLFGMIIAFKDYKEGDLVYVKLEDGQGGYYNRQFYVFPENKESYHIAWVTEHGQLELLEFTGGYSIDSKYDRIENDTYQNLVRVKEILDTDKNQPLKANTGWVLRNNHVLLDGLLRSRKAWLFLPNTDYKIKLVPQSKQMSNYNSDRALYAYDVEFLINPDNDAKVYPR